MNTNGIREEGNNTMESLISLCKRRGFIFQGSEIYGGLAGTWDYGPLGVALKNNIKKIWWKRFVEDRDDMYGVDAALLMNPRTWEASGHVAGFADPLVEDIKTKRRFRADHLLEDAGVDVKGMTLADMDAKIKEKGLKSPDGNALGPVRQFNMMFKTNIGATEDGSSISYLRPETAQGMFVNFKNILDTFHPKLSFGMAQIGKAFRNEIAPRDFLFRAREFEQMEIEYFVNPKDWEKTFEHFRTEVLAFTQDIGLTDKKVHELEVAEADRAFYSKRTIDFEFDFPFGKKELYGLAYRTDYDLKQHAEFSKVDLSYFDEESKERFVPHCIEPSFGLDRTVLAVLADAYQEDEMKSEDGTSEKRVFLKLAPSVAPYRVAVFPLLKNKPVLVEKAEEVYKMLKKEFAARGLGAVTFDDNGNIGKRYRRQDEIGTPYCVTVDFDTIEKGTGVTVRDRDSGKQERVKIEELVAYLNKSQIA
ncbi:MAG TPA: glycine--tRNA ligase [Candidatus Paceibacterota bacterium]|jgi:glycyl-tRNA synthetase|nr:glycine--tRNA ligase [Candidatus Paceibacterota bacterium]